jgi:mannosyltransferase OCH1-like enzyme
MIPHLVHQTWKTKEITHWIFKRSQASVAEFLPDWEYRFWTDEDLDELVRQDFAEFYPWWSTLNKPIKKVDAARYCLLFKHGGMYADLDFVFTRRLDGLFDDGHPLYFYRSKQAEVKGWEFLGNALMMSAPGQAFWIEVLHYMRGLPADTAVLHHTGPRALGAYFASLPAKPNVKIFGPDIFDNERCGDGIGARAYGYHVRTATWQQPAGSA